MGRKADTLSTVLGLAGAALILALVWIPLLVMQFPFMTATVLTDSLWTALGWRGVAIGAGFAALLWRLSRPGRTWVAWCSLAAGAMILGAAGAMLTSNVSSPDQGRFFWGAITALALAGTCFTVSGILRIAAQRAKQAA